MNKLNKRRIISVVVGLVLIVGAFLLYGVIAGMKEEPPRKEEVVRKKEVSVRRVNNGQLATTLNVEGQLQAYNKIGLYTEVGGVLLSTSRPFKEGTYFPKGSVLLRLDNSENRLAIQAQKATLLNSIAQIMPDLKIDYAEAFPRWEAYLENFSVDDPIKQFPEPANRAEKLFIAGRNLQSQYYQIKQAEERLSKFTVYAPFSGVLTSALVDPGAVVRAGQEVGQLMATGNFELAATVPLSDLSYLAKGNKVTLYSEDVAGEWKGEIRRIGEQIDPGSQTVTIYVGVSGKNLREGMYLRGEAAAKTLNNVIEIDRNLLIDEKEVYVVESDSILRLLPVSVEKFNRTTVIVSGLPEGTALITAPVAGGFDGMRVKMKVAKAAEMRADSTLEPLTSLN